MDSNNVQFSWKSTPQAAEREPPLREGQLECPSGSAQVEPVGDQWLWVSFLTQKFHLRRETGLGKRAVPKQPATGKSPEPVMKNKTNTYLKQALIAYFHSFPGFHCLKNVSIA